MNGYRLSIDDNQSYAFRESPHLTSNQQIHQALVPDMTGAPRASVSRCWQCGELLTKWDEPLDGLKIKKRRYDISVTYDGIDVASKRFKEIYESNALVGFKFIRLPDDPDFYQIQAELVVALDPIGSRFEKQCPVCGIYESVICPSEKLLEGQTIPDRAFARSDLEFASNDEKHPLLFCGPAAGEVLKNANLKGLYLKEF
jgi:hypothetical protein